MRKEQRRVACTQTLFSFSFRKSRGTRAKKAWSVRMRAPFLRWRSINLPRFLFSYAPSTIVIEENRGSANRLKGEMKARIRGA